MPGLTPLGAAIHNKDVSVCNVDDAALPPPFAPLFDQLTPFVAFGP